MIFSVSKPSALKTPWLSRFSAHAPSVHHAWPLGRLRTRLDLCSSQKLRTQERKQFLRIANLQHLTGKAISSFHSDSRPKAGPGRVRVKWLVMSNFPILARAGLARRASSFWNSHFAIRELTKLFGTAMVVRISWKNILRSVLSYVSHTGGVMGMDGG